MRKLIFACVFVLCLALNTPAKAWGDSGHRTVCEIAFLNLTPTARAEVQRLLAIPHPIFRHNARNRQFGWACTYPDHPITPAQREAPNHFVNYQRTLLAVVETTGCGSATSCVISAIERDRNRLASRSERDSVRLQALIYLGHWVGDIHQPLHASYRNDLGGNELRSRHLCAGKFHSTWDTCIVRARIFGGVSEPTVDALQAVAANLNQPVSAAARREWQASEPWNWAAESYAFTIRQDIQYCIRVGPACQYDAARLNYVRPPRRSIDIDDAYMNMAMEIIPNRITRAGIRLAGLINRALDPNFQG